jgi:hypothetical protein
MSLHPIYHPTNIIVGNPSFVTRNNKEYAIYHIDNQIMIPESNFPIEEVTAELQTYDMNNINQERISSLFCKFKDLNLSRIQIEVDVTGSNFPSTGQCPLRDEYHRIHNRLGQNMVDSDLEVSGTADITFDFLKRNINDTLLSPKQFTLRNIKINACINKYDNQFRWKIGINPSIIYYTLLFLDGAYENISNTFIEFTGLQKDKFDDMRYYWDMIKSTTENRIYNYLHNS